MSIPHLASGQTASVLPLGANLKNTPTTALFKAPHMEVCRLVMLAGKQLPPHAVAGPLTIQCIEGEVEVELDGNSQRLHQGDLIYLAGNVRHDLKAITDATVLLTIVLLGNGG
ncbi:MULTISPECIES: cupin domain-containing protein [unclassified Cupriavidus]|uniref:cupin domain-containing protein n=1 Tax=unclassified Cupriavidus TaxID=2640874 RepID=UPI0010F83D27|nr:MULTISPECIES: cupin domain-containing protein [unclassified Cupriavidus]MWL90881.1 cupin domain-containing protein [Cupriavidus sp. SW-Y-13]